jgi:hypothetical protein
LHWCCSDFSKLVAHSDWNPNLENDALNIVMHAEAQCAEVERINRAEGF